ncbi:MAG TPA: AMP-binding protein [Ilumatobacter sp.]|nr:AMP-binding protein [Ilumatobacter sp.]
MNLASLVDIPSLIAPDAPAIAGPAAADYLQLRAAVGRGATLLSGLGVDAGDRVALFATNSVEYIEALFAIASVGAVAVPMNSRALDREVAHLIGDSGAKVVLTETRYLDLIEANRPDALDHVVLLDTEWSDRLAGSDEMVEIAMVDDDDLCIVLYTSGTTSLPKGVMLSHGALTDYVMGRSEPADGEDHGRMLLSAPLYHIAGITSMLGALYAGRTVVVMPQFDADAWLDTLERERVTHSFLVPTMLARLIESPRMATTDLSSLESITYGAAPMPPSVIRRALAQFPPTVAFSQSYGQTETNSTVTVLTPEDHRLTGTFEEISLKEERLASVGRAVDDVDLRIVGTDGAVLGVGEIGEVQLRSDRQMAGYWGSGSSRTAEAIDEAGWIHTGDMGLLDSDGYLFLGGRAGDQIIRGGENIAPEEVEAVLYDHPDVIEAGVVGVPDEQWGERVMAAVVLRAGSTVAVDDIVDHCRGRLAGFKRPDLIVFTDHLPRTSTGKLLRRDLPALLGDS